MGSRRWGREVIKIVDFQPVSRCISETVQNRDRVTIWG